MNYKFNINKNVQRTPHLQSTIHQLDTHTIVFNELKMVLKSRFPKDFN